MPESSANHNPTASQLEHCSVTFILPGIADDPVHWEPLREAFDCRIVSYLDWTEILDKSLASLAAHVTRQIQDAYTLGELRLIGYSIGGQLTYSVTRALQSAGIPVSCLILLDAGAEVAPIPKPLGRRLRERLKGQVSVVSRDLMATLVAKCLTMDSMRPLLRRLLRARRKKLPFDFDRHLHSKITIHLMRRMYWPWWHATIESGYSLSTPTFLFRSADHAPFESEDLGWRRFFPGLTVIPVTAQHEDMMKPPNIDGVRAKLQSIFDSRRKLD